MIPLDLVTKATAELEKQIKDELEEKDPDAKRATAILLGDTSETTDTGRS